MSEPCDILIIGGGPAGLAAGNEAIKAGLKVIILEKDAQVGLPVNCGEGVTYRSLHRVISPKPDWILTKPKTGRLVAPDGRTVDITDPDGGYVLDRVKMETDLAEQFVEQGGVLKTNCRGIELVASGDRFVALKFEDENEKSGESDTIEASVFIAADGVEGTIARSVGVDNSLRLESTDAFLQYRLRIPEINSDRIEIHLGREIAPGSYAWVFPRNKTEANVGLGLLGSLADGRDAPDYLDRFVKRRFSEYEIIGRSCGTSPRYAGMDKLAVKNLLIAGDSARLVDSLVGGGICTALHSGMLAAREAVRYLNGELESVDQLGRQYSRQVAGEYQSELNRLLTLKKFFAKLNDREINDVVETLEFSLDQRAKGDLDLFGFVVKLIQTKPRLIKLARHLL